LFILLIFRDEIVVKKDLVDPITAHKGLTVCKYKESNLGPVTAFIIRALIIIKRKDLYVMSNLNKT